MQFKGKLQHRSEYSRRGYALPIWKNKTSLEKLNKSHQIGPVIILRFCPFCALRLHSSGWCSVHRAAWLYTFPSSYSCRLHLCRTTVFAETTVFVRMNLFDQSVSNSQIGGNMFPFNLLAPGFFCLTKYVITWQNEENCFHVKQWTGCTEHLADLKNERFTCGDVQDVLEFFRKLPYIFSPSSFHPSKCFCHGFCFLTKNPISKMSISFSHQLFSKLLLHVFYLNLRIYFFGWPSFAEDRKRKLIRIS